MGGPLTVRADAPYTARGSAAWSRRQPTRWPTCWVEGQLVLACRHAHAAPPAASSGGAPLRRRRSQRGVWPHAAGLHPLAVAGRQVRRLPPLSALLLAPAGADWALSSGRDAGNTSLRAVASDVRSAVRFGHAPALPLEPDTARPTPSRSPGQQGLRPSSTSSATPACRRPRRRRCCRRRVRTAGCAQQRCLVAAALLVCGAEGHYLTAKRTPCTCLLPASTDPAACVR